ncbi:helix-turn-helix domain-containing protein [Mycobacterium lentiflavum]|nr:helix-turn-helix domain-containing protein [Mycobacterium lentiflavum]ULP45617.1 helix-turn-helix domain-containing protein [Mycobacterium lentiflavum]
MAQSAHSEGVSETRIAEELGVDRMTVRKWLGKR